MKTYPNTRGQYAASPSYFFDLFNMPGVYFSPADDGAGGGAGGEGEGEGEPDPVKLFTPEQQAVFNREQVKLKAKFDADVAAIRAQAADEARKQVEDERTKAQQESDRKQAEAQGKWEEVANGRLTEIKTKDEQLAALQPKAAQWDAFVARETERMDEAAKKFGPNVKPLDPGSDPARFEERVAKWPALLAAQETMYPSANYDNDMGRGGGSGGSGRTNQFERIRKEEEARKAQQSTQKKTLDERLGRVGSPS